MDDKDPCLCGPSCEPCSCGAGPRIIFACSGAADVGEIADRAARLLSKDGVGSFWCVSAIGGGIKGIIKSAEAASSILVIDGCYLKCAAKMLEKAGFKGFAHLCLTDLGMPKGKTPVDDEKIALVVEAAKTLLEREPELQELA